MSVLFLVPSVIYLNPLIDSLWSAGALACVKTLCRYFLYLSKLKLYRCCAAKDRDHHFQRLTILVHFVYRAIEVRERPVGDADSLVLFKLHANLGLVFAHVHAINNLVDLFL